jgi:hypothetical protein
VCVRKHINCFLSNLYDGMMLMNFPTKRKPINNLLDK